jgi:hypothetical protein
MSKMRENFAVIEMNHPLIAQDFSILSSLSEGYKAQIDLQSSKVTSEGYDWSSSIFSAPETKWLKGVIWFHLGAYEHRKVLLNPFYGECGDPGAADNPDGAS